MNISKATRCLRLITERLAPAAKPVVLEPEPEVDPAVKAAEEATRVRTEKEANLRAELVELKLSQLKKRARAEGLDEDDVDDVDDADDPKGAIIEMFVTGAEEKWAMEAKIAVAEAEAARVAAEEDAARIKAEEAEAARTKVAKEAAARATAEKEVGLRAELVKLTLKELKKRARAEGLDEDAVDAVDDVDDPKGAIIDLFVTAVEEKWAMEAKAAVEEAEAAWFAAVAKAEVARIKAEEDAARMKAEEAEAARAKAAMEAATRARAEKEASLRAELVELKLSQLKKRARAEGLDEEAVDGVDDAADPKAAITELLIAATSIVEKLLS
jgi:hypothetical protein